MGKLSFHRFFIELNDRQAYVWQRLGDAEIIARIAPNWACAHCLQQPPVDTSHNGWFCHRCEVRVDEARQNPGTIIAKLRGTNEELRQEISQLKHMLVLAGADPKQLEKP